MATTKKTALKVQKDIEGLGHNLQELSKKLLGDATQTTLDAAEKALAATLKQVQTFKAQLNRSKS